MKKSEKKKVIIDLESSEESISEPKKKFKSELEAFDSDRRKL